MTYSEKLRDPRWQKKRLEILSRDEFTCQDCESKTSTLSVHHKYYVKGRDPWEYPTFAYSTLCESCHQQKGLEMQEGWEMFESFLNDLFGSLSWQEIDNLAILFNFVVCNLKLSQKEMFDRVMGAVEGLSDRPVVRIA